MKKYLSFIITFSLLTLTLPAVPVYLSKKTNNEAAVAEEISQSDSKAEKAKSETKAETRQFYNVLDVSTGQVIEVSKLDYIIGAVCAEMPATFETEALKAQAVAAHTYAERQVMREKENPTAELCGADFSNDTSKYQGYFTVNQAKQYYGDNFDIYYAKISDAAKEVQDYIITYNEEPIVSAFHSMSSGKTESAENAWGSAVDYLVSVDSSFDTSAPKYFEETAYPKEVLQEKLKSAFPDIQLGEDFTQWLSVKDVSDAGTVLSMTAGNLTVSGNDMRTALSLRSANFEINYTASEAVFATKGYGHGVGMSQYGANSMAAEGKTWQDILNHYYSGCEIVLQ